ncbi:MAG: TrkH family potassium uptake protein [Alphaproteobacteria bacterium]|nr:MAG: TrkH family potassium uptake protein [Alphaproteobacteria bacterium]TAF41718.1 MAG: TrkH family potassium uptake protein [Alphaproteobacteria bacterium]TAF75659.1 MAG: TrkH family potassium uptake protein [Alphaproteobacteria bacterium]
MRFWRPILYTNGILISLLGALMMIPAIADMIDYHRNWEVFAMCSIMTCFIGMMLFFTNRGEAVELKIRQAFLLTSTSWMFISAFGALPFYLSAMNLSYADGVFETVSGLTTTGSTVIVGLDVAPSGILLWRSMLNGIGGIGIVVMAIAILPTLRVGGMQLFRTESSDNSDKMLPRSTQIAYTTAFIFFALSVLCAWCYWLAGMSAFDAINHAIPTIATGGFSTHDASIGYFKSLEIELICIVFMIAGAMPLMLFYQAVNGDWGALYRTSQVRMFFATIMLVSLAIAAWLVYKGQMHPWYALRHSLFAVVTVITTTGFVTEDFALWGSFATHAIFMLMVVGGCTGSTSGGIKIFRFQVFFAVVYVQLKQLIQPHGVYVPRYEGKPLTDPIIASVLNFFLLFAFCFLVLSLALSLYDLDFLTSMSATAQALANVGPGLGAIIGPASNFSSLPDGAKWILSAAMLLGRLELFTILVLFVPSFWRR